MSQSQDQSEFFRGTANVGTTFKDSKSVDGSSKKAIPAFVFGEELADLADHDERIVVLTADLAAGMSPWKRWSISASLHHTVAACTVLSPSALTIDR